MLLLCFTDLACGMQTGSPVRCMFLLSTACASLQSNAPVQGGVKATSVQTDGKTTQVEPRQQQPYFSLIADHDVEKIEIAKRWKLMCAY